MKLSTDQLNKLEIELKQLNNHFSAKEVTKDNLRVSSIEDGLFSLVEEHEGDVQVFFGKTLFLVMHEINDQPVVDLKVAVFSKHTIGMMTKLLKVCDKYLPQTTN